jgi:uncharacterized cupredoxin-like copper-binding protein
MIRVALATALAIAPACGGDDDAGEAAFPITDVEGTEMAFSPTSFNLQPGEHQFRLVNKGAVIHELAVREKGEERALGRVSANPGGDAVLEVELDDGDYEFVCQEPGHLEAGMRADVTVG